MKIFFLASLTAIALMPTSVDAKEKPPVFVESKIVKDTPTVTLDATKAYVLLRTSVALPVSFSRVATVEDRVGYERVKSAAFDEARRAYAKKLARYENERAQAAKTPGTKLPDAPVEPTEANFRFTPFEQMANFAVGPLNRFAKGDVSVFLQAVTPGTYRFMGQMDPLLGGGLCYCMGSVRFEAVAGKITDLGTLAADPGAPPFVKGDSSAPRNSAFALSLTPASDAMTIDPRLAALPRVNAAYRAAGKMANFWGIAISRLPAIPGILAYDRDHIIDVAVNGTRR